MKHHGWDFNCPADLSESALLALIIGAKIAEDVIPEPLKGRIKIAVDEILKGNNPDFLDTTLINSLLVFAESGATDISAIFPVVFEAWQQHRYLKVSLDTVIIFPSPPNELQINKLRNQNSSTIFLFSRKILSTSKWRIFRVSKGAFSLLEKFSVRFIKNCTT